MNASEKMSQPHESISRIAGYLTKDDVARILKVTPRTVTNWMNTGCLAYYKIGRTIRFRLDDFQAHLDAECRIKRKR